MASKPPARNVISFPVQPSTSAPEKKRRRKNKRADGRYCVRVSAGGKQIPFYSRISLADAKEKAQAFKKQITLGLNVDDKDITIEAWSERWIAANSKGKSHGRIENYNMARKFVCARIGAMPVRSVREIDLKTVVGDLDGYSTSYISKVVWFTQKIFHSAYVNHIIAFDPATELGSSKPKGTYKGHRTLEPWEIDLVLNNWRARRAGIWMMAMMFCGLRRSEAFAASLVNFDADRSEWLVEYSAHMENNKLIDSNKGRGKTDAALRRIRIFDPLRSALAEDFAAHPRKYFMVNAGGNRLTESGYRRAWDQMLLYLEKVANGYNPEKQMPDADKLPEGWKKIHFTAHDLRYTFATFLYDAGVDEKTAQLWMGHESPEMTRDLYAQLTAERKSRSDTHLGEYLARFPFAPQCKSDS